MSVTHVARADAFPLAASRVLDAETVLDLGSGIMPQRFVVPLVHICVDAHRPYLQHLQRDFGRDPRYVFLHGRWDEVVPRLPDRSVDSVFALDFIEHLEKDEGLRMLREAERVARRQVVVYTPHGFYPQTHRDGASDRWGLDGGDWQTHRSGWTPEDFGRGWDFVISPDFLTVDEHEHPLETPMGALWAFRNLDPPEPRRYLLTEDSSAWWFAKRAMERALPAPLFRFLQKSWCILTRSRSR